MHRTVARSPSISPRQKAPPSPPANSPPTTRPLPSRANPTPNFSTRPSIAIAATPSPSGSRPRRHRRHPPHGTRPQRCPPALPQDPQSHRTAARGRLGSQKQVAREGTLHFRIRRKSPQINVARIPSVETRHGPWLVRHWRSVGKIGPRPSRRNRWRRRGRRLLAQDLPLRSDPLRRHENEEAYCESPAFPTCEPMATPTRTFVHHRRTTEPVSATVGATASITPTSRISNRRSEFPLPPGLA